MPALVFYMMSCIKETEVVQFVDPNIGGVAHLLQPTHPTVRLPDQIIRMYPVRKDYLDDQIESFALTIISHRDRPLFEIMPFTGDCPETNSPVSAWDKQNETITPYCYSVWLEDFNIDVKFTPGSKTGYFRFTYPKQGERWIELSAQAVNWSQKSEMTISGEEYFYGMKAFIYGKFNYPIKSFNILNDTNKVRLDFAKEKNVEFKYGISNISPEQAKKNLENELANQRFEEQRNKAKQIWESKLGQIEVKGGTES